MSYSFSIGASYGSGYGSYGGYYPYNYSDYLQSMRAVIEDEALSGSYGYYNYPSYASSYGFGFQYGNSNYFPSSFGITPDYYYPAWTSVYNNPYDYYYLPSYSSSFYSYSSLPNSFSSYSSSYIYV